MRSFFKLAILSMLLAVLAQCNYRKEKIGSGEGRTEGEPQGSSPTHPQLQPTFSSIHDLIFSPRCMDCHSSGHSGKEVPLNTREDLLDSPRDLVLPGNPEESGLLIAVMRDDKKRMPPIDSGIGALSTSEIEILRTWIREGAK